MARLFPLRSETPSQEGPPRVVGLEDEEADAVFAALSSTTARRIYARLNEEPATPSDVADAVDSSIQNVRYHLEKLEEAGLVEVVDTWYSSRGNEMSVYAPANGPLIVTGDETKAGRLREALSRFLGGVAALAGGSLLVQALADRFFGPERVEVADGESPAEEPFAVDDADEDAPTEEDPTAEDPDDPAADGPDDPTGDDPDDPTADDEEADDVGIFDDPDEEDVDDEPPTDEEDVDDEPPETEEDVETDDAPTDDEDALIEEDTPETEPIEEPRTDDVYDADPENVTLVTDGPVEAADAVTTLPPGLLFFLGGLVVLVAVVGYWYWAAGRPVRAVP